MIKSKKCKGYFCPKCNRIIPLDITGCPTCGIRIYGGSMTVVISYESGVKTYASVKNIFIGSSIILTLNNGEMVPISLPFKTFKLIEDNEDTTKRDNPE